MALPSFEPVKARREPLFLVSVWSLALVTFVIYLAVGLYYVTGPISPFHNLKLTSKGDAFLEVYPWWNASEEFDDAAYNRVAISVLRTGIPRDKHGALFFHAPVYGYFVAACYGIGGIRLLSIAVPQALIAALTCVTLAAAAYNLAQRAKPLAGLGVGLLFVINLRLAMYVGYVSPTVLLEFFFSVAILAASRPLTAPNLCLFVAACVLAMGTQAAFFVVGLAAAGWLFLQFLSSRNRGLLIASGVLFFLAAVKVLLPTFVAQDLRSSSKETAQGILWEANNPYYEDMTWSSLWERRPGNPWTHWQMSATEQQRYDEYLQRADNQRTRAAILWVRENPGQYAKLTLIRLWTTIGPITGMMSPRNKLISAAIWLLVFPAGCYGWWLCRNHRVSQLAGLVTLALTTFSALVIVEWYLRYRFPVDLLMTLYAGLGYSSLLTSRREKRSTSLKNSPA